MNPLLALRQLESRGDVFRASKIMVQRALANPKITVEYIREVAEILAEAISQYGVLLLRLAGELAGNDTQSAVPPHECMCVKQPQ